MHAARRHRRLLGADPLPGNDADLPAGSDDLLPARDARRGEPVPEQPAHDRRRRRRDDARRGCASRSGAAVSCRAWAARRRCRRARTRAARSSACTFASPSAGTAGASTPPTTRATWRTRRARAARRRTRSRCRRSRRSTATRRAAARASRSRRAGSTRRTPDFVNAWKPGALRKLVDDCLNALVHCGRSVVLSKHVGARLPQAGPRRFRDSAPPPPASVYGTLTDRGYLGSPCAVALLLVLPLLAAVVAVAGATSRATAAAAEPAPVPSLEPAKTQELWRSLTTGRVRESRAQAAECRPLRAVFYAASDWLRLATKLAASRSAVRRVLRLRPPARRRQDARSGATRPRASARSARTSTRSRRSTSRRGAAGSRAPARRGTPPA